MDAPTRLTVKIFSPYQVFYKGTAVSVSGQNKTGNFDVLYNHSNFFSLLPESIVTVNTGFESIRVQIGSGVMKVTNNSVELFANV